jgi:hypothetical protein
MLKSMYWKRIAGAAMLAALAFVHPLAADAAAAKTQKGSIYLFRGLANIFSLGLDTLHDELAKRGVKSTVLNYNGWMMVAQDIEDRYRTDKNALPVIVMGHSFGADVTLELAAELKKHGIPVALIVEFDAVTQKVVPSNVQHVINFYEPEGIGLKLVGEPGFHGKIDNIDLSKSDPDINHLNIEKSEKFHARAIAAVLAALGR